MKQSQYLHAVQHLATQLSKDLKIEKQERLKLNAILRQLEDELTQLRRQANEPSSSSLPVPSSVDPSYSASLQGKRALEDAQILKPFPTITKMGASSNLEPRIKHLEEKISNERGCREKITSTFWSQFTSLHDKFRALESWNTKTILWKVTALRFVFDAAKTSTQLDNAVEEPSTHYNTFLYRTQHD